jgi:hypothetical protein
MKTSTLRNFDRLDAIILVAASAAGFALIRVIGLGFSKHRFLVAVPAHYVISENLISATVPFLTSWTLAFLVIRMRRPRHPLQSIFRQPGTLACIAASLGLVYEFLWMLLIGLVLGIPRAYMKGFLPGAWWLFGSYITPVFLWVAGAWLTLAIGGWWRSEPSWVDRLGRVLGLGWILAMLVQFVGRMPQFD